LSNDSIMTTFGDLTVIERKDGKITVLVADDVTATFDEEGFYRDFVEPSNTEKK